MKKIIETILILLLMITGIIKYAIGIFGGRSPEEIDFLFMIFIVICVICLNNQDENR